MSELSLEDLIDYSRQWREWFWRSGYFPVPIANGAKRPFEKRWPERARAGEFVGPNVPRDPNVRGIGIECSGLRAIDFDVDDTTLIGNLAILAGEIFGSPGWVRYRDNSPRLIWVYRAAEDTPPKRTLKGTLGTIEVLGRGQQFVAIGTHPSGVQYKTDRTPPARDTLPSVTEEQIGQFFEKAAAIIGTTKQGVPRQKTGEGDLIETIKSGENWHDNMLRLIAQWVTSKRDDAEILAWAEPLTLGGYSVDDTMHEMQAMIDGARKKGFDQRQTREEAVSAMGAIASAAPDAALPGLLDQAIARLAALDPNTYELCRTAEAKALGLRIGVLDRAVKAARGTPGGSNKQGSPLGLAAPEPWPELVDGVQLLGDLADFFARHLVLPAGAADFLAVWSLHTHCFECARHTPRLAISSPEKQCGKTTVLDLLQMVVCKPLPTANVTAAAVFRTVEACAPTLLVDEADTFLGENEGLRGVLNAGHKRGGQVIRCVGDDAEPRTFAAFSPAAIASIGALPGTIADRSVQIIMRRATQAEQPQPIRGATEGTGAVLARKAARWAADHAAALLDRDPALPGWMANRVADNWRSLFAIAEGIGGQWPARLEKAAKALADADDGREGLGVALLRDVRTIFAEAFPVVSGVSPPADAKLPTAEIVRCLVGMEDRPWPEISHGKALTATRLTRMVKPFGIARKQWRLEKSDQRFWGFHAADFNDAFSRYLPPPSANTDDKTGDVVTDQGNPGGPVGAQ